MPDEQRQSKTDATNTKPCPSCGKDVPTGGGGAPHEPFCSKRCRSADLGHWLNGSYRISRDINDADLDTID